MTRNWRFFLEMLKKNIFVVEPPHLKKNYWSSDTRSWVIAGFNAKILRKKTLTRCLWTSLQISNPISLLKIRDMHCWYKPNTFSSWKWGGYQPPHCPTCAGPLRTCSIRGRVDASVAIGFQLPAATIGGDASKQREKNPGPTGAPPKDADDPWGFPLWYGWT